MKFADSDPWKDQDAPLSAAELENWGDTVETMELADKAAQTRGGAPNPATVNARDAVSRAGSIGRSGKSRG